MWPFKKKPVKTTNPIPKEIKDFYESERRGRSGVAWLLAFGTLVTTLVLALALFFGGRWVYRKLKGTDTPTTPSTSQNEPADQPPTVAEPTKPTAPNRPKGSPTTTKTTVKKQSTPSQSAQLANTGAGNILGVFVVTTLLGSGLYYALCAKESQLV